MIVGTYLRPELFRVGVGVRHRKSVVNLIVGKVPARKPQYTFGRSQRKSLGFRRSVRPVEDGLRRRSKLLCEPIGFTAASLKHAREAARKRCLIQGLPKGGGHNAPENKICEIGLVYLTSLVH